MDLKQAKVHLEKLGWERVRLVTRTPNPDTELSFARHVETTQYGDYELLNFREPYIIQKQGALWLLVDVRGQAGVVLRVSRQLQDVVESVSHLETFVTCSDDHWGVGLGMAYLQSLGLVCEIYNAYVLRAQLTEVRYVDNYYRVRFMWHYSGLASNQGEMFLRCSGTQWIVEGEGPLVEASAPGRVDNLKDLAYTLVKTLNRPRFDT
jgi:hypothetical protein